MGRTGGIATHCLVLLPLVLSGQQWTPCALAQSTTDHFDHSWITAPPNTAERFVIAGNTTLHYVDSGNGRPVVMIHGNAGDLKDFDFGVMALLVGKYRVLAFDLPGHGLSKMPGDAKGTIQEQAVTLHQALTALCVTNPILVGHSWVARSPWPVCHWCPAPSGSLP